MALWKRRRSNTYPFAASSSSRVQIQMTLNLGSGKLRTNPAISSVCRQNSMCCNLNSWLFSRPTPSYKTSNCLIPINLKVNLNKRRMKNASSMAKNGTIVRTAELVAVGIKLTKQANTKRESVNPKQVTPMAQTTNSRLLQPPTMPVMALIWIFSLAKTANYAFT